MSTADVRLSGPVGRTHPVVLSRRLRELVLLALSVLLPLALAFAISVQVSHPSLLLLVGLTVGGLGVVALMVNPRYEISLAVLMLYLGLLEGPVKLGSGAHEAASVVRDVLIFSVATGAFLRMVVKKERLSLPPLSAWVLAFVALVLVEALNPKTVSLVKALGGFRQQLEWVPFFFFGYSLLRTKQRIRTFFLLLGVIALANGVVSTYQTRLSPGQLASWGPGYRELVYGTVGGLTGRTYVSNGESKVRPPGLGADAGFSGGVGVVALTATLALLASGRLRRRWFVLICSLGALLGIATSLGRLQVVGAVVSVLTFAALSFSAGRRVTRPLATLLGVAVLAIPLGAVLVSVEGSSTFSRYASIAPGNVASSKDKKTSSLTHIPKLLEAAPFGVGLGIAGAASGFGGQQSEVLEGHAVSSETEYNFIADELGLPGLLLWVALTVRVIALVLPRLRRIADIDMRLYLAAMFSAFVAMTIMGFSGPTTGSAAFGPFFWAFLGVVGYWFLGSGWRTQGEATTPTTLAAGAGS
jgi:hypothetical protein